MCARLLPALKTDSQHLSDGAPRPTYTIRNTFQRPPRPPSPPLPCTALETLKFFQACESVCLLGALDSICSSETARLSGMLGVSPGRTALFSPRPLAADPRYDHIVVEWETYHHTQCIRF